MEDSKIVAASYIIQFYNDLENLNTAYPYYINNLIRILGRYGTDEEALGQMEDNEKNEVQSNADAVKTYIIRSYIRYEALREDLKNVKDEDTTKLKAYMDAATIKILPERKDVEGYVIALNRVFTSTIMYDFLNTSKDTLLKVGG